MTISLRLARPALLGLVMVALTGSAARADYTVGFNDLTLAPNTAHTNGAFQSGGLSFNNSYNTTFGYWSGGFAYSNINNTTTAGYTNDTAAITGQGRSGAGDIYALANGYHDVAPTTVAQLAGLPSIALAAGTSIAGMYVTNTTYAYFSMLNGDQFAKKFGGASGNDPDFFKITAYGVDAAGALLSNTVDFFLADFRSSNNAQDYIVKDWRFWDLSSLSNATRLYFNVSSSDVGTYGLNTPAYFAIDDIAVRSASGVVPEPTSLALVGLGLAGVAGVATVRRRKAQA